MNLAEEFKRSGFVVLRNMIGVEESAKLYQYTLDRVGEGNPDDGQVPGSPSFYQDPQMVELQKKLLPSFEAAIQYQLLPVFTYHRVYRQGAVLRNHKDSVRAEISASMNLGQKGEPWALWLLDYDERAHPVTLQPGDALLYFGMKLFHWRAKLDEADFVSQVMFHFVDKRGKNTFAAKSEAIRKFRKKVRSWFGQKF